MISFSTGIDFASFYPSFDSPVRAFLIPIDGDVVEITLTCAADLTTAVGGRFAAVNAAPTKEDFCLFTNINQTYGDKGYVIRNKHIYMVHHPAVLMFSSEEGTPISLPARYQVSDWKKMIDPYFLYDPHTPGKQRIAWTNPLLPNSDADTIPFPTPLRYSISRSRSRSPDPGARILRSRSRSRSHSRATNSVEAIFIHTDQIKLQRTPNPTHKCPVLHTNPNFKAPRSQSSSSPNTSEFRAQLVVTSRHHDPLRWEAWFTSSSQAWNKILDMLLADDAAMLADAKVRAAKSSIEDVVDDLINDSNSVTVHESTMCAFVDNANERAELANNIDTDSFTITKPYSM
jgi:hypothetical protein